MENQGDVERPYYAATVFPEPWIADHRPLRICLGGTRDVASRPWAVHKINNLEPEDWLNKYDQFHDHWDTCQTKVTDALRQKNLTRLLDLITQGLQQLFPSSKRDSEKLQAIPKPAPLRIFCRRRREHPY